MYSAWTEFVTTLPHSFRCIIIFIFIIALWCTYTDGYRSVRNEIIITATKQHRLIALVWCMCKCFCFHSQSMKLCCAYFPPPLCWLYIGHMIMLWLLLRFWVDSDFLFCLYHTTTAKLPLYSTLLFIHVSIIYTQSYAKWWYYCYCYGIKRNAISIFISFCF